MYKIVLLRHGQSHWNKEKKFTGWTDIDITEKGYKEAERSGEILKKEGYRFDMAFTSYQKRAIRTLWIALDKMDLMWIPVYKTWRLNERHYGALQGLNKVETAKKEGEEQVHIWRRSFATPPPPLEESDERHPIHDPKYKEIPKELLPASESLKDTIERFMPYWHENIVPEIQAGKNIIISAHGNTLRALVKHLDNISEEEITGLNIPTGVPLVYELDKDLNAIKHYYLGDQEAIKKEAEAVKNQGK